jgi:hypothetical protein
LRKVENEINLLDSKGKNQSKKEFKTKQAEFTFLNPIFISITTNNQEDHGTGVDFYMNQYQFLLDESIDHPPCYS